MKNLFQITSLAILMLFGSVPFTSAQTGLASNKSLVEDLSQTTKYALGATTTRHIKAAHKTYQQLVESGVRVEEFVVVIWGPVVKEITKDSDMARFIDGVDEPAMSFEVCEMAMQMQDISREELGKEIHTVPNAFIRLYQLQALGYNVIIP